MSKLYEKKKQWRRFIKLMVSKGDTINDASGKFVSRVGNSSMIRDYYPQK